MPATPTQRTLEWLRRHGWTAAVVERWNHHSRIRQDLFGFIDVVAVHGRRRGVLAVQATSTSNIASRVSKIRDLDAAQTWLAAGNRVIVIGWSKRRTVRKDGKLSQREKWFPKVVELRLPG